MSGIQASKKPPYSRLKSENAAAVFSRLQYFIHCPCTEILYRIALNYFLLFHKLPSHFVNCFFCCAEIFYNDIISLTDFCFLKKILSPVFIYLTASGLRVLLLSLVLLVSNPKNHCQPDVKDLTHYVFFQEFCGFKSYIQISLRFELIFVFGV